MVEARAYIAIFVAVYLTVACYGMLNYAAIWDEGGHNFVLFFVYDALKEDPGMFLNLNVLKNYALEYNTHYSFYSSIFYHPPLYKMFVMPFFFLLGPNIVSLRLPTLILGAAGIIISYILVMEITGSRKSSVLVSFLFAFSHAYLQWSSFGNIDVALTVFVLLSMYFFVRYEKTGKRRFLYLFGVFTGFSFLLKLSGVAGLIIVALYYVLTKRTFRLLSREFIITCLIVFAIAFPWIIVYSLRPYENISTIKSFVLRGNIFSMDYWPKVLFNLAYFVSVPGMIVVLLKRPQKNRFLKFLLVWIAVYFFAFVIVYDYASGFPRLFLPALFPVMTVVAMCLENIEKKHLYLFAVAFVAQGMFFWAAYAYNPPTEKAVDYVLRNSPNGSGIIITNANQQFYIMSRDRDRNHFSLWFSRDINTTINAFRKKKNYTASINVSYLIADTQTMKESEMRRVDDNFVLEKSYTWTHFFPFLTFMEHSGKKADSILIYRINRSLF